LEDTVKHLAETAPRHARYYLFHDVIRGQLAGLGLTPEEAAPVWLRDTGESPAAAPTIAPAGSGQGEAGGLIDSRPDASCDVLPCFHEAGHAVVDHHLGRTPQRLWVGKGAGGVWFGGTLATGRESPRDRLTHLLAGAQAVLVEVGRDHQRLRRSDLTQLLGGPAREAGNDLHAALRVASTLTADPTGMAREMDRANRRARLILLERWAAIHLARGTTCGYVKWAASRCATAQATATACINE
jgi:hypothetical protein